MKERDSVQIGDLTVGDGHPVCIVAELGVNHLGDPVRMREMIHAAHEAGADMLKFQIYKASKRYDTKSNPKGAQFTRMVTDWEFPEDVAAELWDYAVSLGATVFSSVFDVDSLTFMEGIGSPAYKLAAFEIVNHELLRAVAATGKPVVFSRGMASHEEVDETVRILREHATPHVVLHTISSYPTLKRDSCLWMIHDLRERYGCPVGHSDHTRGTDIPPLATAAGANMIEKHFTVNPKLRESDNPFSVTPDELREMVFRVRQVETYMGKRDVSRIPAEDYMWSFRRVSS